MESKYSFNASLKQIKYGDSLQKVMLLLLQINHQTQKLKTIYVYFSLRPKAHGHSGIKSPFKVGLYLLCILESSVPSWQKGRKRHGHGSDAITTHHVGLARIQPQATPDCKGSWKYIW